MSTSIQLTDIERVALATIVDAMMRNIETDLKSNVPKKGDEDFYPVYVNLFLKLTTPPISDRN
jgi:hypothetical protein